VLGALEVAVDGRRGAPAGAKERTILARLLVEAGRTVTTDALLDAGWPDEPPGAAGRSLQVRVARLRAFLEPGRPAGAPSSLLVREGGGYRLAIDPGQVDAVRFERLVGDAAAAPPRAALGTLDEALALWRGAPYADVAFADFAQAEIRRLDELGAVARARRLRALVDLGLHEQALPHLAREAAEQPLREELVRTWALALYRAGRQVEALDALRALAARLAELGLEPAHETRALEHAILVHDPALAAAAAGETAAEMRTAPPETAAPSRLPRPAGRFFGREPLLARAAELLGEHGLVTIAGVGGAGKTRLSLELAARAGDRFAAGPWWCELAPVRADDDVAGAVADALGLDALDDEPRLAAMTAGGGLLLLDNCEHVVDGAAAAVERLLACCPALRIVATSRVPLGVDAEHVVRLGGLELPADAADAADSPAVALFADRLRRAGGTWDDADAGAVAELCRRLDGLPLALELAAARARSMTPAEIAARLHERLSLLAATGRRANPRHATLGAAIDWSYELLDPAPRRLFERLSVFARGGTLDDVRATCAGYGVAPDRVATLLDELVAHSLVTTTTVGGRTRYGLLETLREYGAQRLVARGERGRWRDRHADRYADRARAALESGFRERRLPLVDEFDELRAAIRWCLVADATPDRAFLLAEALWWPAPARRAEEIAKLVDEVVGQWSGDHPYRGRALGAGSVAWLVAGRAATAHERAVEAIAVGERVGDASLLGRRTLAQIAFFAAPPAEALAAWRDLAARARADGVEALGVEADGFAVQLLAAAGDLDAAIAGAAAMRADADRLESPFMVSWSRYVSGVVALERDPEQARRWLERALALSRETDHHHMVRFSLRALGLAAAAAGDDRDAAERMLAALAHDDATADGASQRTTLRAIATVLAERGRADAAAELLGATEGWPAAPLLRALAERARERLAEALDRGRALDLEAAKALARAELGDAAGGPDTGDTRTSG